MKKIFTLAILLSSTSYARFTGGPHDGFTCSGLTGYQATSSSQNHESRFHGGPQDGSDNAILTGYQTGQSLQNVGSRFHGGAYDGQDSAISTLPDLWEATYYASITATGRDDDTDMDNCSAHHELIADTDPTDPMTTSASAP